MKLVATSPFLNVRKLRILAMEGVKEGEDIPKQIPKGAKFTIGREDSFHQLDADEQLAIASLWNAGRVVTPDNVQAIKIIEKEIEAEKRHAARLEEQTKQGNSQAFVEQFMAIFRQMTAKKA